jgi:transposase InsO family protein
MFEPAQNVKRTKRFDKSTVICHRRRQSVSWNRVNVDMVGPYTVKTPTKTYSLRALTMIDPATCWFEVKDVSEPSSEACMCAFDDTWLMRYPRPQYIGYDNGNEYKNVFKEMCLNYGIKGKTSTTYNPQSNGIIERVHQVLGDSLRTFELEEQELNKDDPWSPFLSAVVFAIRSTYHTTLEATPAQLVYGRNMILPVKFTTNWVRIREKRQQEINKNNDRKNCRRKHHTYSVGDKILLTKPGINKKMASPRTGPHVIKHVYDNGTIPIKRGAISERINIRRVTPFFEDS